MTQRQRFAAAIAGGEMVVAPGCYDAMTAKLIERAGFAACYMTGAGTAAAHGLPDYGLAQHERDGRQRRPDRQRRRLPVIADADTGFGNELNVTRAVYEYERAGVAAIHLEDQGFPKKCGHLDGKVIVPAREWRQDPGGGPARQDPAFKIIARTDANADLGFDDAVARANAALEAGADIAFVEAPKTPDEVAAVPRRVNGPCLFNLVVRGKSPPVELDWLAAAGYALTILPDVLWREMVVAAEGTLALLAEGRLPDQRSGPT